MPRKTSLLLAALISTSVFAQAKPAPASANTPPEVPLMAATPTTLLDSQVELALRAQCRALASEVVTGFLAARSQTPIPESEAAQAGASLPEDTDIAAQAIRVRRQCIKQEAGQASLSWAALELMAQAAALRKSALRCLAYDVRYLNPVSEAEMELAGCHVPEYPGTPGLAGGKLWNLYPSEDLKGALNLEARAAITGEKASAICALVNDYHSTEWTPVCRIRDDHSVISLTFQLKEAPDLAPSINQAIKQMVEDYRKAHPELLTAPSVN